MSTIKLNGTTSGSSIIKAPDSGSTNQTFTLPASSGTLVTTTNAGVAGISSSADATAITIGSDESVGINNSTGFGTYSGTGVKYSKGDGTFFVGRDGGQPLWLNRETSQGDLIGLATAGSTYARIGTTSNALVFKTGTGGNTERMRILADGGLTFNGDTAAANALDDYEEGTWTPVLGGSTHRNGTWSSTLGIYTKIGNIVHLYFGISGSGMYFSSELGYQAITGVPFTAANPTGYSNYSGSWSGDDVVRSSAGHVYLHTNNIYMHAANSNPSTTGVTGIGGYISYRTNS